MRNVFQRAYLLFWSMLFITILSSTVHAVDPPIDVPDFLHVETHERIQRRLVDKPAPQLGQTRAYVESLYGPAQPELAPGKTQVIYTNEYEGVEGQWVKRTLSHGGLRVYEITYSPVAGTLSPADKVLDVKLRVIPREGDHRNLVSKILGQPVRFFVDKTGTQRAIYSIPKERVIFYNDILTNSQQGIQAYFDPAGVLTAQEIIHFAQQQGDNTRVQDRTRPAQKLGW